MSTTKKVAVTALAVGAGRRHARRVRRRPRTPRRTRPKSKTVTLVSHDSFAVSEGRAEGVQKETGYTVKVLKGGDAGRGRQQGDPHQGQPAGRRLLRRRQHPALPRPRQRPVPPYEAKGLDQVPAEYQLDEDKHRVTPDRLPATSASTTTRRTSPTQAGPAAVLRRPDQARVQEPPRHRERRHLLARPRLPARHRRASTATTAGRTTGRSSRPTASRSSTAGSRRTTSEFSGSAGGKKAKARPAARRLLRLQPARRGASTPTRSRPRRPTGVATGTCFRQIEFAGLLERREERARAARRCSTSCSARSSRRTCRSTCSCTRCAKGAKLPEVFTKYGAAGRRPGDHGPRRRSPRTVSSGSSRGPRSY